MCFLSYQAGIQTGLFKWPLRPTDRLGLELMVCHYPRVASKWNSTEHRLFGPISLNWTGNLLRTLEAMLAYIRCTTTQKGLKVKALVFDEHYEKGLKVAGLEMRALNLERQEVCPNWNDTIRPCVMAFAPLIHL